MKRALLVLLAFVAMIGVAAAAFLVWFPAQEFKPLVEREIERATGVSVSIGGDMRVSVWPRLSVVADDVRIANPEGPWQGDLARVDALALSVEVWPLMRRALQVERIGIKGAMLSVQYDPDTGTNLAALSAQMAARTAPAGGEVDERSEVTSTAAGEVGEDSDDQTRPEAGELAFGLDALDVSESEIIIRMGPSVEPDVIGIEAFHAAIPALDEAAEYEGTLGYRGWPIDVAGTVETPRRLLDTRPFDTRLTLQGGENAEARFAGTIQLGANPSLSGELSAGAGDLPQLVDALGLRDGIGELAIGSASMNAMIEADRRILELDQLALMLDDLGIAGSLTLVDGPERPALAGRLAAGHVDLPALGLELREAASESANGGSNGNSGNGHTPPPEPWPGDRLDLSVLRAADVDLRLEADSVRFNDRVEAGATELKIALEEGRLEADLDRTSLFDGSIQAGITVAAGAMATDDHFMAVEGRFEDLRMEPILILLADEDRLSGLGSGTVDLAAQGGSIDALVRTLDGVVRFDVRNGAFRGLNLAATIRNLRTVRLDDEGEGAEETDFSELSAGFRVQDGVAVTEDLRMLAPVLRLEGRGEVDLPRKRVDFSLRPRITGTLEGQGGAVDATGLEVPVRASGEWTRIRFSPDLEALGRQAVDAPGVVRDQLQRLEDLAGSDDARQRIEGVLDGLLGSDGDADRQDGGSGDEGESPDDRLRDTLEDGIRNLFGR